MLLEEIQSGERLIEAVRSADYEVRLAFWAKLSDEFKWYLYLASPFVDQRGRRAAYDLVLGVLDDHPDLCIDALDIRVIGMQDTLAEAALSVATPKTSESAFAVQKPGPYRGMTRFQGSSLGGIGVDGAYIYPPAQPVALSEWGSSRSSMGATWIPTDSRPMPSS